MNTTRQKLDCHTRLTNVESVRAMIDEMPTAHDAGIRMELRRVLAAHFGHDADTLVVDEFGIFEGRHRIDVAVINGSMHGYEIKSERDTLMRLRSQAEAYERVFDYLTLVATAEHLEAAAIVIPTWWGMSEAVPAKGRVSIRPVRRARQNPAVDPSAQVQLLWRDEVAAILDELGIRRGLIGKPRRVLWQYLVETLDSPEILGVYVRETIRMRSIRASGSRPT